MAVLGIICCEILELECAHLLATDPDIVGVTVVEDAHAAGFIEALKATGRFEPRQIPLLRGFSPSFGDGLEVLVRVLELGLHSRKRLLQEGLVKAVTDMARYVDGIMLGYGLCGNALEKPEELLADAGVPLFLPQAEGETVDDCVGLIIGGRTAYYEEQCREAGTFFMIPGWTKHWRRLFDQEYGQLDPKMAKRIFSAYKRSLLIPTPVLSEDQMRQNVEEFNRLFDFSTAVRPGTLAILQQTWDKAKHYLTETGQQ
ncbi:MAG: DUF1638 domain-containing protein [Desulfobaccales bacterium]